MSNNIEGYRDLRKIVPNIITLLYIALFSRYLSLNSDEPILTEIVVPRTDRHQDTAKMETPLNSHK